MAQLSDLIAKRFGLPSETGRDHLAEGTLADILGRRTYRKYSDEPVSEDLVRVLLACAQSAAAKSDMQQYSIIWLDDPGIRKRLAELSTTAWMETAPVSLVFCGDIRRAMRLAKFQSVPYGQNTLDSFMNAAIDAALAMQTFSIAAESRGLGVCFVSQVRNHIDQVAKLLGLPPGVFPIAGVTAGWPDESRDAALRLPPSVVVHRNRYDDADLQREIDAYDQRRHAIRPITPDRQMHTNIFGVAAFYGWSANTARRLSQPEGRETLLGFLKNHGFELE